jgi:hypothetical protein
MNFTTCKLSRPYGRHSIIAVTCLFCAGPSIAHEPGGGSAPYEMTEAIGFEQTEPRLHLEILDRETKRSLPARFSLELDGSPFVARGLDEQGIRLTVSHQLTNQRFTALYSRGTGALEVPLSPDARSGTVYVVKGYEYLPAKVSFDVRQGEAKARVELHRWSDIAEQGWFATDEHLHFDRTDARHDAQWLTILSGEGLSTGHFLVLKGGNFEGVWAKQYAYGAAGEAYDGLHLVRSGEEYRDSAQGHINLLGLDRVVEPISTGGIGTPSVAESYPPFAAVLQRARESGGIGGHAHGGTQGRSETLELDAVLGMTDFVEIANAFLTELDAWYRLMNCGFNLPPTAGTDLPYFPYRSWHQPLLGEPRMYLRTGTDRSFDAWKAALGRGEVFVTSGPIVQFTVNGVGPGGLVRLPEGGGEVEVIASLASPRPLKELRIIRNGQSVAVNVRQHRKDSIQYLQVRQRIRIDQSSWLAAYGIGETKALIQQKLNVELPAFAHTAAVRILVGDKPIRVAEDVLRLGEKLKKQRDFYRVNAVLANESQRLHFTRLFDEAISKVEAMAEDR